VNRRPGLEALEDHDMTAPLTTSESKTLKEIRAAIKGATEGGDHHSLAAIKESIVTMLDTASPALAAALKALPLVRAQYRAESDEALLQQLRDLGDEHGYGRATEDEENRGIEYVIETVQTPRAFAGSFGTDEQRDFIANKLGTTAARLDRLDWYAAYGAGLVTGYHRRGEELGEHMLNGWSVGSDGVTVRGRIPPNDMEAWEQVFLLAAEQITGLEGGAAQRVVDSVVRMAGQIEDDPRETGGVRELFPWRLPDGFDNDFEIDELHEALRREYEVSDDVTECEFGRWGEGDQRQVIFFEETGRCGVVFNGDPIWTDAKSIEEGIGRVVIGQVIE